MIRSFVAIRPPEDVCDALLELQADVPVGRPVAPENLHFTLLFLGEHPAPVVEDVAAELARIRAAPLALSNREMLGIGNDDAPVRLIALQMLYLLNRRLGNTSDGYGLKPNLNAYLSQFSARYTEGDRPSKGPRSAAHGITLYRIQRFMAGIFIGCVVELNGY